MDKLGESQETEGDVGKSGTLNQLMGHASRIIS